MNTANDSHTNLAQALRRLRKTVLILSICVLVQAIGLAAVCWRLWEIISTLELLTQRLNLLALRLDLLMEFHDDVAQILNQILELLGSLPLQF